MEERRLLDENIKLINRLLLENGGIADEADRATWAIALEFDKRIRAIPFEKYGDDYPEITYKATSFKDAINGHKVLLSLQLLNYPDEETREKYKNTPLPVESNGSSVKMRSLLQICGYIVAVDGKWGYDDVADAIGHEVSHLYQQDMAGKSYKVDIPYMEAAKWLRSPNEAERSIATIIYLYKGEEQDAFVNGLYAWIKANAIIHPSKEDLAKSDTMKWMNHLRWAYEYKSQNRNSEEVEQAIEKYRKYGVTTGQIVKHGEIALEKFGKKIQKTLKKWHDVLVMDYGLRESASVLLTKSLGERLQIR